MKGREKTEEREREKGKKVEREKCTVRCDQKISQKGGGRNRNRRRRCKSGRSDRQRE